MKYMGGKTRLAKYILPIILKNRKNEEQWYVEPFVGGGNVISKATGNRIGADIDKYTIGALKLIRDFPELIPKDNKGLTENMYKLIRNNACIKKRYPGFYGYIGRALSFGGEMYGGYRKSNDNREYVSESHRAAIKQNIELQKVKLINCPYWELTIPEQSIIYCDIPYKDTTGYSKQEFDYLKFYKWCEEQKEKGHEIYISEYWMPLPFKCIFKKEGKISLNSNPKVKEQLKKVEKLYTL